MSVVPGPQEAIDTMGAPTRRTTRPRAAGAPAGPGALRASGAAGAPGVPGARRRLADHCGGGHLLRALRVARCGRSGRGVVVAIGVAALVFGMAGGSALAMPEVAAAATPATLTITGGTPQVAKAGTSFPAPLTVTVTCGSLSDPVQGAEVTFEAPTSGPSATFTASGTAGISVMTDATGSASASAVAGPTGGTYAVTATVASMGTSSCSAPTAQSFALTNSVAGIPSGVIALSGTPQSAAVGTAFTDPLQAEVVDPDGQPVAGVTVVFAVQTASGAGATFATGGGNATAVTSDAGIAVSPVLTAGSTPGSFTATATIEGGVADATYQLTDVAGLPATVTAGFGASQQVAAGTAFPVNLAVTVTDADHNAVPGVTVTFEAPATGPTGTFAGAGTTVTEATDSSGVAVAPTFTAGATVGGYVVTASVAGVATPAVFELVNQVPPAASGTGASGTGTNAGASGGGAGGSAGAATAGYRVVAADGAVFAFGGAPYLGGVNGVDGGVGTGSPVVGLAAGGVAG